MPDALPETITAPPRLPGDCTTLPAHAVDRAAASPAVPGYEILAELGRGGMGVVYKARDLKLNRIVALKMILSGEYASPAELTRFLAEAEAVAQLQHPNIIQIHEIGRHGELPYFTLEYIEGGSLAARARENPLPPGEAAAVVEQLARGVGFAHAKGIVHRDLKPENVLLAENGTPKVTDFGVAKRATTGEAGGLTKTGAIVGTPSYMAPEQAAGQGKSVGPGADIYALGAILYRLITGRPPFLAAAQMETLLQVVNDAPVPPRDLNPQIPRDLETICLKCLRKEPAKRYPTAEALADELQRFYVGKPIVARPVGAIERGWLWCRRNRSLAAALSAVAASLVIGATVAVALAGWAMVNANRAKESESRMRQEQEKTRLALEAETRRRRQLRSALDIVAGAAVNDLLARRTDLEPGQRAFLEQAVALYQELIGVVGDDADTLRSVADGARSIGQIQQRLGHMFESESAYRIAADHYYLLEEKYESERDVARAQQGVVWNNLGNLYRSTGRPREAEGALVRALRYRAPGDVVNHGRTLMNLALVRELYGDVANAEKGYLEVLALVEPAAPGAVSTDALDLLAGCCLNLGSARMSMGRSADAVGVLRKAVSSSRKLVQLLPTSPDHRNKLGQSLHNLSGSLFATGDTEGADGAVREAIEVERALVDEFPGVPEYRADLAKHCDRLAMFLRQTDRRADALPFARDAVRESAKAAAGRPNATELSSEEAGHHQNLATLLAESQKFDEAEPEMRRAQACWARIRDPRYTLSLPYSRLNMMRMLSEKKKAADVTAESVTLANELDQFLNGSLNESDATRAATMYGYAASYNNDLAARAFAAVRRAAAAGAFRHPGALRKLTQDSEFEIVRKQKGFDQFVAELSAK
jgi:tetratricopeptide (TPR) repeat protein/tRNA A-37 threonylcarbamoyl transferase component Bud32